MCIRDSSSNKAWVEHLTHQNPTLLPTLAQGQKPSILWLGCSDSRVPETTVLGLQPGDVFTTRNIANIIHPGDLSAAAVVEYAVANVGVAHVVLCGHTGCGGVNAALGNKKIGVIDTWLLPLRELRAKFAGEWAGLSAEERAGRLVEENVRRGVMVLRGNPNVIAAVRERGVVVHGCVYDVKTGLVRELDCPVAEGEEKAMVEAFATA